MKYYFRYTVDFLMLPEDTYAAEDDDDEGEGEEE